ncbi:Lrp/AsnC family transcriptional regulator (plasmid) [Aminobacter sp. SR38]|jgi:DNA-binding Lrp family transcriptional regulator|uniref:Lrp/AsnC family transcriptional regulator n=1 Tax=Aminobacter sp. SR38 TaxID=2774562 RepID=UPI001786E49F|nr:Lrp/AsnC family transcriptional regulator [Aminobacter sp. SR38]QOF75084.1 Lrp/AsnC family transcriptional regulator [Aminobacter sp. SR38]
MSQLNSSDYAILEMLQSNARVRMEDIASKTSLSVATVQRRIKALKSEGVIASETAVLQPELVGFGMTFLVMVELERERLSELELFRERVCAEPQIQQCYYVTGEFDFVMIALSQDVERFKRLTHRLFFDNPNVKRFRTSLVMDRTKVSLSVPLEAMNGTGEGSAE